MAPNSHVKVGPMRTCSRCTAGTIGCTAPSQKRLERSVARPAGRIPDRYVRLKQCLGSRLEVRPDAIQVAGSSLGDFSSSDHKFVIPCLHFGIVRCLAQGRIPLSKSPVKSLPLEQKRLFHVEHTPVQEAAAPHGAVLNKLVDPWVDCLDGQVPAELGQRLDRLTADLRPRLSTAMLDADGESAKTLVDRSDDAQMACAMPDGRFQPGCAK
jgi:hypothetical protein